MSKTAMTVEPRGGPLSPTPKLHVDWMTWIWVGCLVILVLAGIIGFQYMQRPMF